MQDTSLVSIIIPVYNGADYMREAIDSALAQTYSNIEIIVVNDGSTDAGETERIALSYGDKIRYFYKENGGCASALNYGISKMRGEYFSWLSHDDVYMPNKIETSIKAINDYSLDSENTVILCKSAVINDSGTVIRRDLTKARGKLSPHAVLDILFGDGNINGCALLIPKKVLDTVGEFSTEYIYILDYRYWIYIALNGFDYFEIREVAVKNRRHKKQVSVTKNYLRESETKRFIHELTELLKEDSIKLLKLWNFCVKIGLKDECCVIEKYIRIPFSKRIKATLKRTIYVLLGFLKRIYRKIYGLGSLK